jgi:hypothetical protein
MDMTPALDRRGDRPRRESALPRDLADRMRRRLVAAGFDCADIHVSDDEHTFVVEPERAGVAISVARDRRDDGTADGCEFRVTADFEGDLLDLWTPGRRREAALLLHRIEEVVRREIAS